MSWLRPWRVLAVMVAALIAAPLEAAIQSTEASAQVWKPRSRQKPRAKGTAVKAKSPPKKARKASSKVKPARTKAPVTKKKKAKKARRAPRGDDDFTIIEEDYPDED